MGLKGFEMGLKGFEMGLKGFEMGLKGFERRLVVWETENGSSLTFAGTQNSNMSDEGAKNNNKEVFPVFVTPFKPSNSFLK